MESIRELKIEEFHRFCDEHLDGISEMELLILKGHVLVEYSLNCYLETLSRDENPNFFRERFTFAEKIKLIKHFSPIGSGHSNLIRELILFNKLRNNIAHQLSYDSVHLNDLHSQIKKKMTDESLKSNINLSDRQKLKISLDFLLGAIFAAFRYFIDKGEVEYFVDGAK